MMNAFSSIKEEGNQDIYIYLVNRIHEPCFIIFNDSGSSYLINKKFAAILKYRSVKEFYQHNETLYKVFTQKDLKGIKAANKNASVSRQITITDKQKHAASYYLQLRYIGYPDISEKVICGIIKDEEVNMLDQALLSFLNNDEFLDEAMFILDFKGNMLAANRKIHQIDFFADLTDKNTNFFSLIDDSEKDKLKQRLRGLKKGLILPPVEYKLVSPDNKTGYIKLYSRLIIYKGKKALISLIRDITLRKQTEKRLIQAIIETEENERQRFASDLHDELGPFLSGFKLYLHEIKSLKDEPRKQIRLLNYLLKMTDEASNRVRTISSNLTPTNLTELGLVDSVKKMINQINLTGKILIKLKVRGKEDVFDNPFILTIYHVILELINNGLKHSGSNNIQLVLWFQVKNIQLVYTDNGKGFELNDELKSNKGIGLKSILNRVTYYRGSYKFINRMKKGVRFELNFPRTSL